MKRSLPRRSSLFLIEIIVAVLFFSLSSGVCMQFFTEAKTLSRKTSAQSHALILAKSASAVFEGGSCSPEMLAEEYPLAAVDGLSLEIYYDADWNLCSQKENVYTMEITIENSSYEGRLVTGTITVFGKEELCKLSTSCYIPARVVTDS